MFLPILEESASSTGTAPTASPLRRASATAAINPLRSAAGKQFSPILLLFLLHLLLLHLFLHLPFFFPSLFFYSLFFFIPPPPLPPPPPLSVSATSTPGYIFTIKSRAATANENQVALWILSKILFSIVFVEEN